MATDEAIMIAVDMGEGGTVSEFEPVMRDTIRSITLFFLFKRYAVRDWNRMIAPIFDDGDHHHRS